MPIEIRELVIKAAIGESEPGREIGVKPSLEPEQRDDLIADCVEQVMELLRAEAER